MTYATQTDLERRYGVAELEQLTDRDGTAGAIVEPVLADALARADQVINGYVSGRYAVPLHPVPDLVNHWASDIARHFLHWDGAPDHVRKAYEDALAGLGAVAKGVITLQAAGVEAPDAPDAPDLAVLGDAPAPVFTDAAFEGF